MVTATRAPRHGPRAAHSPAKAGSFFDPQQTSDLVAQWLIPYSFTLHFKQLCEYFGDGGCMQPSRRSPRQAIRGFDQAAGHLQFVLSGAGAFSARPYEHTMNAADTKKNASNMPGVPVFRQFPLAGSLTSIPPPMGGASLWALPRHTPRHCARCGPQEHRPVAPQSVMREFCGGLRSVEASPSVRL